MSEPAGRRGSGEALPSNCLRQGRARFGFVSLLVGRQLQGAFHREPHSFSNCSEVDASATAATAAVLAVLGPAVNPEVGFLEDQT